MKKKTNKKQSERKTLRQSRTALNTMRQGDTESRIKKQAALPIILIGPIILGLIYLPIAVTMILCHEISRNRKREKYYAKERVRRIELRDGRKGKIEDFASIDDVTQDADGKLYIVDKSERERRLRLASQRRKIKEHRTTNQCPTADEITAQWAKVKESHIEMLKFGSMLCDLETYVDNGLIRDEYGEIVGRHPGIKGWLAENCPGLIGHYKLIMRYKVMAVKARQAVELHEPTPVSDILPVDEELPSAEELKPYVEKLAKILAVAKRKLISHASLEHALYLELAPEMARMPASA